MKKLLVAALVMLPLSAGAVEDKEIVTCASEKNTVLRLACFDDLAARHSLAPSSVDTSGKPGSGVWSTRTSIDPMTDTSIHTAILLAESGKSKYGKSIVLAVRCANNMTELWVSWDSYLGNRDTKVTHRVGKDKPKTAPWSLSTNNQSTFYPGSPVNLLKSIAQSTSFVANVTPYNASPITAVFDTTGADTALADIRKDCGW